MKNHTAKIPGTIFARRNFTPVSLFPHLVLPLVAGWLAGCSSLSDYMSQPMIIDASQRQVPSVKWEDRYENHPNPDNPSPANNAIAGDPQTDSRESAPESGQAEQNPLAASQPPQNSNTGSATADQPDYTQNNALVKRTATDSPGQPLQPDPPRISHVTIQEISEPAASQNIAVSPTADPATVSNPQDPAQPDSAPHPSLVPEEKQIPIAAPPPDQPTGEDIRLAANLSANDSVTPALNIRKSSQTPPSADLVQPAVAQRPQNQNQSYRIDDTIQELEKHIARNPDDLQAQVALRCLYLAYGQEDKALQLLPELPADQQAQSLALTQALHLSAQTLAEKDQDPVRANQALEAVNNLSSQLADKADLRISRLEICKPDTVKGFGRFETFPRAELETGRSRTVQVYCELQNFKSEVNADGKYLSKLHCKMVLYDISRNYKILKQEEDDIQDVPSNSPRQDFFLRGSLNIPALEPGNYQVAVTIEDKIAQKIARPAKYDFEVKPSVNAVP